MSHYTDQWYVLVHFVYFASLRALVDHELYAKPLNMKDQQYMDALMASDILLPDGIALQLLWYRLSHLWKTSSKPSRIPNHNGTDFVPYFLQTLTHEYSVRYRIRIVLYWSYKHVVPRAHQKLSDQWYDVIYSQDGYNTFDRNKLAQCLQDRLENDIVILLVWRGSPVQEIWSHESLALIQQHKLIVLCVWGLIDFWSGKERRAPYLIRRFKGERVRRFLLHPHKNMKKFVSSFGIFPTLFSKKLLKL